VSEEEEGGESDGEEEDWRGDDAERMGREGVMRRPRWISAAECSFASLKKTRKTRQKTAVASMEEKGEALGEAN
jgi:hypothetical protein